MKTEVNSVLNLELVLCILLTDFVQRNCGCLLNIASWTNMDTTQAPRLRFHTFI